MKIALFTDGIFPLVIGGMQRHSAHLLKYLGLNGVNVDAYHFEFGASVEGGGKLLYNRENTNVYKVPAPPTFRWPGHYIYEQYLYSKNLYSEYIKTNDAEKIYIQGFSGWFTLKNKKKLRSGTVCVLNFHGLEMFQQAADVRSRLQQYLLRPFVRRNLLMADFVVSNGKFQTDILLRQGVLPERILVMPIAIEKKWIREGTLGVSDKRRFLFIGRFERRRGIQELNAALKQLIAERDDFEFNFICPIPEGLEISSDMIHYRGKVSDEELLRYIDCSDVLVNPTFAEGMSYVNLESMARGLAVVACDVGAVSMSVNNENGWLIKPASVSAICKAMVSAIEMPGPELLHKKEISRRKVAENYIWENRIRDFVKLLENCDKRIN